jgi:hypothetical protein
MLARMPRPKPRLLETNSALRALVQHYLDQRWSPEQIVQELQRRHGRQIAVETVYQALYSPKRIVHREPSAVLRLGRPYRRPRRRGDQRRPRFVVPIRLVDERPIEARDRLVPGHWAGDLIVGAFNRSAIGTLVERTTRYTVLVHGCLGERPARTQPLPVRPATLPPPDAQGSTPVRQVLDPADLAAVHGRTQDPAGPRLLVLHPLHNDLADTLVVLLAVLFIVLMLARDRRDPEPLQAEQQRRSVSHARGSQCG